MAAEPRFLPNRFWFTASLKLVHLAFIVRVVMLAVDWTQQALPSYLPMDWANAHEYDGLVDWKAARLYLLGRSPYTADSLAELNVVGFGHPPTTAFWFIPLAGFEKAIAAEVISLSTWFLLPIHIFLVARELRFPAPYAVTALVFSWLLTTGGLVSHWHAIQLSEQIAFPITLCWIYLRRGRELPAGIALGAAATFKLFPGILMLFLLAGRRFSAFAASVAVFLGVAALMTARYGLECWPLFLRQQSAISQDWLGSSRNASLHGIILRLFYPVCEGPAQPNARVTYLAVFLGALLLIAAYFLSRKALEHARVHDPRAIDLPFALFSVLAAFLNPWIWEHYLVLLIQPAFVVIACLGQAFHNSWKDWLGDTGGYRPLILSGILLAFGLACLGACTEALGVRVSEEQILELWRSTKQPWAHAQFHLLESYKWLPWVLMLVVCMLCVWRLSPSRLRLRGTG